MAGGQRVCPRCGSTDLGHDPVDVLSRLSLSHSVTCRDCGYSGIVPEVDPDQVEDYRAQVAQSPEPDPDQPDAGFNRGRFVIGVVMLLLGVTGSTAATWGSGLLATLLSAVIGAAIVIEQLSRR